MSLFPPHPESLKIWVKLDIMAFNPHPFQQVSSYPTIKPGPHPTFKPDKSIKIWVNSDIMALNHHPFKQVSSHPTLNQ